MNVTYIIFFIGGKLLDIRILAFIILDITVTNVLHVEKVLYIKLI